MRQNPRPSQRHLKGYAFDPSLSLNLDTAGINDVIYSIPWEDLKPGPEGEYIKVVDRDPASDVTYRPVDLNHTEVLASNGILPSVSNPQFHQQMVYAVAMNTITNFESAIGRKVMWSPVMRDVKFTARGKETTFTRSSFVKQLVIYPHAFRDANAYYSPDRKALLFGYFTALPASADLHMPGSLVYTCLSHDIVAHETTHAILDGIFRNYMDPTHPDVSAFHEAFADIVALFQHFTFPETLRNQIAKTKGNFDAENLLGKLAVEFGLASGGYGALRDGIGTIDPVTREWYPTVPNVGAYQNTFEPHDRGSILVAAVFDAFISIYNQRTADLIRIATNGTGKLPEGSLNWDLVKRLADEAAKTASHILNMCIRALDYCPPVDINFGDYLRAIITADAELVANDDRNYRIAFITAFSKWGIYPEGVTNLSVESLIYAADDQQGAFDKFAATLNTFLREFKNEISYVNDRQKIFTQTKKFISGKYRDPAAVNNTTEVTGLHEYFFSEAVMNTRNNLLFEKLTGLVFSDKYPEVHIRETTRYKTGPSLEIHSLRLNNRVSPDGKVQNQAIITLVEKCGVKVVYDESNDDYNISTFSLDGAKEHEEGCFVFRGGTTLIFDLNTLQLLHVISKPLLDMDQYNAKKRTYAPNRQRVIMQYRCQWGDYAQLTGAAITKNSIEPFAHIHHTKSDLA